MDLIGVKTDFIKNYIDKLLKNKVFKSKAEIAKKLDVKPQYLNTIYKGHRNVSDRFFNKFVKTFNINQNDLSDIENEEQLLISKDVNVPKDIPLVTPEALGGFGNMEFAIREQDIQGLYKVPDFINVDFMIRVKGSSMYPKYNSGDVVACRIIRESKFIQWNKVHVIATREQGILIKRIDMSEKEECLKAISDNKDYRPFDIPKNEVTGLALVVGVIRLE